MTVPTLTRLAPSAALADHAPVRCVVCHREFNFGAGEAAVVLRHVAYGYDFAHAGACLTTALQWIFVEPGYDCAAFSVDTERTRILGASAADGWFAVLPGSGERIPLRYWALVEHRDGSSRVEGIVRDPDWDEPGGAEFPEAGARRARLGYVSA